MRLAELRHALSPFGQFEDASRGDLFARAAAHQRNLRLRAILPRYLLRWGLVCASAAGALRGSDALASGIGRKLDIFVVMAAGSGLICAWAVCSVLVIGYAYLSLCRAAQSARRP
ncbi:MAG TPA: hypothetical protein VN730_06760 [Steroidobacteraceae bacterium]|nr:hypothetical protein [Steroidobacteraceae bacterium]